MLPRWPARKHHNAREEASAVRHGRPETREEIMNRLHIRLSIWTITLCMFFVLSGISAMAKPQASTTDDQAATTTTKKKKKKAKAATDAPASGDQAATDTAASTATKSKKSKKKDATAASSDTSAATRDTTP